MDALEHRPIAGKKFWVSLFIIGVLASQSLVAVAMIEHLGWPFVCYPMYSWPHHYGETIDRYALFGTLQNGQEVPITADDLNMNFWEYLWGPVAAVRKNDVKAVLNYVTHDRHLNSRRLVSIRLEDSPLAFTSHGAQKLPTKTVNVTAWKASSP